jgi:hypothetical protein
MIVTAAYLGHMLEAPHLFRQEFNVTAPDLSGSVVRWLVMQASGVSCFFNFGLFFRLTVGTGRYRRLARKRPVAANAVQLSK